MRAATSSDQPPGIPALQAFLRNRDPASLLSERCEFADKAIVEAAAHYLQSKVNVSFAVTAVGGYGRRELFPFSDVDLLVVVGSESAVSAIKEPLSHFLRSLWDTGLRVSHSVRTPAECGHLHEGNIELHISLLDLRFLYGDRDLFETLSQKLADVFSRQGATVTRRLVEMARNRHEKFNNTVYHLEPNIKEAPGGIRDIHVLRWLAQLLPQHEAIGACVGELSAAVEFLFALRSFVHLQSGRDNNLLTFELQDQVARALPATPLSPEEWMRLYFQHARHIFQSAVRGLELAEAHDPSLLRQFRDWRSRLSTGEFTIARDRILLRNAAETLSSAESVLRLFTFVGRHGLRLSWDTQRRIRAERSRLTAAFRDAGPSWAAWRDFFSQPNASVALEEMQETGLLTAALPEWREIDSLVVRDFYHRYTVDEHTFVAIRVIDDLFAKRAGTPPRFHDLAVADSDHALLRLALLLHDLGKGTTPGEHVRGSLDSATGVMRRMKAPGNVEDAVLFLIEHHLDLSLIMTGRDLEDTGTARFLTSRVGTQEDLLRLTLLTYADISAVNPTAMTPWRLEQLWRVYTLGSEQLTHELATDRIHDVSTPSWGDSAPPELARFLEGFPKRYLRTHTRQEIERHFALEKKSKTVGAGIEITHEAGAYLLAVVAQDEPGLFASLCGALASFGMNIVKAEAASNADGFILDLIRFTDPLRTLELNPEEVNRLQWTIECIIRRSIDVVDLLKRRRAMRRPTSEATIVPSVRFNNEASDTATLVDFVGEDRPGLLYDLASVLRENGCNIEVVMIDTEAHKAIDVFYVTCGGGKLDEGAEERLRADLIRAASPARP
jgi:[protein-PII] uridylyltransferase